MPGRGRTGAARARRVEAGVSSTPRGPGQTDDGPAGVDQGEPAPVPSEPTPVPETTASQAPAPTPAATTAVAAQEQLPRTGADAGPIALAGTLLLASGVALRVRLSAPGRRRP